MRNCKEDIVSLFQPETEEVPRELNDSRKQEVSLFQTCVETGGSIQCQEWCLWNMEQKHTQPGFGVFPVVWFSHLSRGEGWFPNKKFIQLKTGGEGPGIGEGSSKVSLSLGDPMKIWSNICAVLDMCPHHVIFWHCTLGRIVGQRQLQWNDQKIMDKRTMR